MDYAVVSLVALFAAGLAFFSGFGLGTLLLPAMALFFPAQVAVAATAVVHLANNLFKLALVARFADRRIAVSFGIASAVGAFAGAWVLSMIADAGVLTTYTVWGQLCEVTVLKLVIAAIMLAFAVLELTPALEAIELPRRMMVFGGVISGFFGGLSGHQGALRSAFLARSGMSKEAMVGTRCVCAVIVDVTRLIVYGSLMSSHWRTLGEHGRWGLLLAASGAAFAGTFAGSLLLKSVTLRGVRLTIGVCLLLAAVAIGAGVI